MGFTQALKDQLVDVQNMSGNVGESALRGMNASIGRIADLVNTEVDTEPVIRPVLDLSNVRKNAGSLNAMLSYDQAIRVGGSLLGSDSEIQNGSKGGNMSVNFTQNNYSPKALSRFEIYRQTKNQLSAMKGLVVRR